MDIRVLKAADLTQDQTGRILQLFDLAYEKADHGYLLGSFEIMRWIALAMDGDRLAGFAIGEGRIVELPRLTGLQPVALAGIGCIDPEYRQQGLFARLALASVTGSGLVRPDRRCLFCGRTAHAITYRTIRNTAAGTVPLAGVPMTEWHTEMILRIAELYGVRVDPQTCVVTGKGRPIGTPRLNYQATDEEIALFSAVDRSRGDSLLTIGWLPEAPEGW